MPSQALSEAGTAALLTLPARYYHTDPSGPAAVLYSTVAELPNPVRFPVSGCAMSVFLHVYTYPQHPLWQGCTKCVFLHVLKLGRGGWG